MDGVNKQTFKQKLSEYKKAPFSLVLFVLVMLSAVFTVFILLFIIGYILIKGIPNLTPSLFAWNYNSDNVSMLPAIINTLIMTVMSLAISATVGILSAVYLSEYAKRESRFVKTVRITTETLQGIPSIVFGLFGYLFFVIALGWGNSLIAGVVTLSMMVLPLIMRTTEEALNSVPDTFREGSYGLGAGKLRTIVKIVLPSAMPGIISGVILAIGRIVGESAALIFTAGTFAAVPGSIFDSTRTLAVHMYCLYSEGLYTNEAYATAVVLLVFSLGVNALSKFASKKLSAKQG